MKIFQKKVSKSFAGLKRSFTFAPAIRNDSENKKEEYVHRHIELTANIRESKTFSSRFENNLATFIDNIKNIR